MYVFKFIDEKGADTNVYVVGAESLREAWRVIKTSPRYKKYKGIRYERKV